MPLYVRVRARRQARNIRTYVAITRGGYTSFTRGARARSRGRKNEILKYIGLIENVVIVWRRAHGCRYRKKLDKNLIDRLS